MPDWKGLLKKGTELAKQAKSELEERGVIGGEQQRTEPAGPGLDQVERSPADQAREVTGADHPDSFQLLTTEDVAAALGVEPTAVPPPTASVSDGSAGPRWTVHTGGGEVTVDLQLYVDAYDVDELTGYGDDGQRLPGVGDKAATSGDLVAVSRGGETVSITVSGAPSGQARPAMESLARAAAARLPDFSQYAARMSAPGGPVLTDVLPTEAVSAVLGVSLEVPSIERSDDEVRVTWREPEPAAPVTDDDAQEADRVRVEVTHYLVDPWEKQQRMADSGGVFAKVAVQLGEVMKEQLAEHFRPVPGPWDEGYLGPAMAYFKKGGRSFKIEVEGSGRDTSSEVSTLAHRLAEGV